jgi:hypothetical protein
VLALQGSQPVFSLLSRDLYRYFADEVSTGDTIRLVFGTEQKDFA